MASESEDELPQWVIQSHSQPKPKVASKRVIIESDDDEDLVPSVPAPDPVPITDPVIEHAPAPAPASTSKPTTLTSTDLKCEPSLAPDQKPPRSEPTPIKPSPVPNKAKRGKVSGRLTLEPIKRSYTTADLVEIDDDLLASDLLLSKMLNQGHQSLPTELHR